MTSTTSRAVEMRRQAESMFAVRSTKEVRAVKEREKAFTTEKQKTERLRALRLARESKAEVPSTSHQKSKARD
jgi:hypothetical protein